LAALRDSLRYQDVGSIIKQITGRTAFPGTTVPLLGERSVRPSIRYSSLAILTAALVVVPSAAQKTTGPKARYEMDVRTMSGMGMGALMGGGLGGILGGGGDNRMLDLRLESTVPAPQQPEKGDHFFLAAAKMGKSVPLLGDVPSTGTARPAEREYAPDKMEKPKGRMLIFWGCHEKAPKGQPFIIDFSKMPTAKMPPMAMPPGAMEKYAAAGKARDANAAWWPNEKGGKQPKSGSSLIGEHRIASNFTPEIKFSLANNYMGALNVNASDSGAAIQLGWNSVPTATGYAAWAMGGMERAGPNSDGGGDMVMWTSASNRDFSEGMGYLSPAEVQKQIGLKNVMPPSQTSCAIPAEAKTAAGGMMFGSMNAFGPEENFAFPPKPADPKAVWNIEWTAKARFQSFASFMTGMGGGGMGGAPSEPRPKKPCKGPFGVPIPGTSC
jgi:hypothetical protein